MRARAEVRWDHEHVWIEHRGQRVAGYARSYEPGTWHPAPRLRPEPPAPVRLSPIGGPAVVPPELGDYAALCA